MKVSTSIRLLILASLSSLPIAFAAPAGKRLIEVKPGQQFWATPAQIESLSKKAHLEGKCGGFMDITDYPVADFAPVISTVNLADRDPKEQAKVMPILQKVDEANLIAIVTKLSAFENRDYNTDLGILFNWFKGCHRALACARFFLSAIITSRIRLSLSDLLAR